MIVQRKLWCLLLTLPTAEAMGEVDDDCMEFDGEVCLLQSSHFLRRSLGPWDEEGRGSAECPGSPVKVNAQPDKCSYEGVTITVPDGRSIEDFFDDNVEMKDFFYYVGNDRDVRIQPETHPFQLGESRLTVVGHDLAGNDRACHRTVIVSDAQRPAWTKDPTSVDSDITTYLDDACTKPASTVFSEYEKLGWVASGSDNCPTTGVQKQANKGGDVLYDDSSADSADTLTGPGTYEMIYTLTDGAGLLNRHTVVTHLKDNSAPTAMECPEDVFVEIEANETHGPVTWDLPYITADNCLGVAEDPPTPQEVNGHGSALQDDATKRHGDFPVGVTPIVYPMADAAGNLMAEECRFTAEVKQKAHPVVITCPETVTVNTLPMAGFGTPTWPAPTATQGGVPLPEDHITYLNGVLPTMPFPYGETTVTVRAKGEVTGTRTREEEQFDECSFTVKVQDPQRPDVDGRHYRCGSEDTGVEPYGVCDGSDLSVVLHTGYEETGGYDLEGVKTISNAACCPDENGKAYSCQGTDMSALFKFCQPAA